MIEKSDRMTPALVLATILVIPFILFLMSALFNWFMPVDFVPEFMVYLIIIAYYFVPSPAGIITLLFAAILTIFSYIKNSEIKIKAILISYGIIITLSIVYVFWWHLTGQKYDAI